MFRKGRQRHSEHIRPPVSIKEVFSEELHLELPTIVNHFRRTYNSGKLRRVVVQPLPNGFCTTDHPKSSTTFRYRSEVTLNTLPISVAFDELIPALPVFIYCHNVFHFHYDRDFAFGAPVSRAVYWTCENNPNERAVQLRDAGLVEVLPVTVPEGRHPVSPRHPAKYIV